MALRKGSRGRRTVGNLFVISMLIMGASALLDLTKAGKIAPRVDKCYSLNQVPEAIRYLEQKHAGGKL